MADKDGGIVSAAGDLAEAFGNEVSGSIPGADAGQSKDSPSSSEPTPEPTPSASGSDTHDGSDGSGSDTAETSPDGNQAGEGDGLLSVLGGLAKAFGDEVSRVIPGMPSNDSSSPSEATPSVGGSGTHYASDGSPSDTATTSADGKTVRRDRNNDVVWDSEVRGDRTDHWLGGKNQSVNPTHFTIDRGNGTHDHYRCSDNAPVGSSVVQPDGSVNNYDPNGNYTGHRSAE